MDKHSSKGELTSPSFGKSHLGFVLHKYNIEMLYTYNKNPPYKLLIRGRSMCGCVILVFTGIFDIDAVNIKES